VQLSYYISLLGGLRAVYLLIIMPCKSLGTDNF
jgi:hypothetical protein